MATTSLTLTATTDITGLPGIRFVGVGGRLGRGGLGTFALREPPQGSGSIARSGFRMLILDIKRPTDDVA